MFYYVSCLSTLVDKNWTGRRAESETKLGGFFTVCMLDNIIW